MARKAKYTEQVQFMVEPHLKAAFDELCEQKGLTMSEAFRLYVLTCVNDPKKMVGGAA